MEYLIIVLSTVLVYSFASQMYKKVKTANTIEAYNEFLKEYPKGKFSDKARVVSIENFASY